MSQNQELNSQNFNLRRYLNTYKEVMSYEQCDVAIKTAVILALEALRLPENFNIVASWDEAKVEIDKRIDEILL